MKASQFVVLTFSLNISTFYKTISDQQNRLTQRFVTYSIYRIILTNETPHHSWRKARGKCIFSWRRLISFAVSLLKHSDWLSTRVSWTNQLQYCRLFKRAVKKSTPDNTHGATVRFPLSESNKKLLALASACCSSVVRITKIFNACSTLLWTQYLLLQRASLSVCPTDWRGLEPTGLQC